MFRFRKVRESREPPGLERVILGRLPVWWLGSTVVPVLIAVFNHWYPLAGTVEEIAKREFLINALCIGAVITAWTAVLTVAIGCIVVIVMKGPHYAADSYPVEHASRPDPD
jgi:ABC-type Fe3+ transport system permease subunit